MTLSIIADISGLRNPKLEPVTEVTKRRKGGRPPKVGKEARKGFTVRLRPTVHQKFLDTFGEKVLSDAVEGFVEAALSLSETLPLVGRVAGGAPIIAEEDLEGFVTLPARIAKNASFALRVRGDSMTPLINDGDLVLVRRQPTAERGEVVVVMLEGEATVKRWCPENGRVMLKPENPDCPPIYTDNPLVIGKVVASVHPF